MNRWRVGEDRGSKEMDGCPLTVSFVHIRNSNRGLLIIWYLLYKSMGVYCLVKDLLWRDSLAESVMDFRRYGKEFLWQ
jgi:hypothetical protein